MGVLYAMMKAEDSNPVFKTLITPEDWHVVTGTNTIALSADRSMGIWSISGPDKVLAKIAAMPGVKLIGMKSDLDATIAADKLTAINTELSTASVSTVKSAPCKEVVKEIGKKLYNPGYKFDEKSDFTSCGVDPDEKVETPVIGDVEDVITK